mmetsp:Transcript_4263/g.7927  ORF Transcript_4263/g.7927 Transcript_4263/m.7927 type:complete len:231 (-) Transcript_4263:651-1343(-)
MPMEDTAIADVTPKKSNSARKKLQNNGIASASTLTVDEKGMGAIKILTTSMRFFQNAGTGSTLIDNIHQLECIRNPTPAVMEHLDGIQQKFRYGILDGVSWIPPPAPPSVDPLDGASNCIGKTWAFVWDPDTQFRNDMPPSQTCVRCESANTACSSGRLEHAPYLWEDQTVYLFHRRVLCNSCGANVPTIEADVLENLPMNVASKFPHDVLSMRVSFGPIPEKEIGDEKK